MAIVQNIQSQGFPTVGPAGDQGPVCSGVFISVAVAAWAQGYGRRLLDDLCCDSYVNTYGIDPDSQVHYNRNGYCERPTTLSGVTTSFPIFTDESFYRQNYASAPSRDSYKITFSGRSSSSPSLSSSFVNNLTLVSGIGRPPTSVSSVMAFSTNENCLYLHGGVLNGQVSSDMWKYSFVSSAWTKVTPSGAIPSARQEHTMAYNSISGTLLLFGGAVASGYVNDFWSYSPSTNSWTQLATGSASAPGVRAEHTMCFDSVNNMVHIWGGRNATTVYQEYFQYDFKVNSWSRLTSTSKSACSGHTMVYDPQTNSLILYGGNSTTTMYGDIYQYYIEPAVWVQRYSTGTYFYASHCSAFDPINRRMLSTGGQSSSTMYRWSGSHNLDNNVWRSWSNINIDSAVNACCAWNNIDNSMYIFGGMGPVGEESSSLYRWVFYDYTFASGINSMYTAEAGRAITQAWSHLDGITVNQTVPLYGQTKIYYAMSFDNKVTWKIFRMATNDWYSIVQASGSYWQYRESNGSWVNSSVNTQLGALNKAFSVSGNQWTRSSYDIKSSLSLPALPFLTSNINSPSPYVASASSEYSTSWQAWQAFTDVYAGNCWCPTNGTNATCWLQIDLGTKFFRPTHWRYSTPNTTYCAKRFGFVASNDLVTWDVIDTTYSGADMPQLAANTPTAWVPFNNTPIKNYRYLRFKGVSGYNATSIYARLFFRAADNSPNGLTRAQLEASGGFVPGSTQAIDLAVGFNAIDSIPSFNGFSATYVVPEKDSMTLISKSWGASVVNPKTVQCLLRCKLHDLISLNTDLKVWVSMDDGNNYEQVTNLSLLPNTDGYSYIVGYKNNLLSRNDLTMKLKIEIYNYKNVQIYGTCLGVDYV
jgi:hypothetical protein